MSETFDFIVVGAGSAGAVVAARLSEDPSCRVALLEAGGRPPAEALIPAACASLQQNPVTDWMYTADPGKCGLGLADRRMMMPRGKMLGGSSGINYMAYVRGHPGDFDAWAEGGATGWSYRDVLPYFRKSEGLAPSDEIPIDMPAHNTAGPLGVSVRSPILPGAREFVDAAVATGIPRGDYNGRDRGAALKSGFALARGDDQFGGVNPTPSPSDPRFPKPPIWETQLKEVAPSVYAYIQAGGPGRDNASVANAGIIAGDKGVAVIDTLTAPIHAKTFIAAIRRVTDKP